MTNCSTHMICAEMRAVKLMLAHCLRYRLGPTPCHSLATEGPQENLQVTFAASHCSNGLCLTHLIP